MEKEFTDWYQKNEVRFHSGQFNERQVAYAAWLEGRKEDKRSTTMDKEVALKILERYNDWCRGKEIPMLKPELIGQAIDKAIEALRLSIVNGSLDLRELERKIDEALGKETRETLTEWLKQQRQ